MQTGFFKKDLQVSQSYLGQKMKGNSKSITQMMYCNRIIELKGSAAVFDVLLTE